MNRIQLAKRAIVIGIAGTMVLSDAVPVFAAPVPSSTAIVKASAPDMIDHVRSRRSQRVGAGIALGVIGAAAGAIAGTPYRAPRLRRGACWIETDPLHPVGAPDSRAPHRV